MNDNNPPASPPVPPARILIVDDQPAVSRVTRIRLERTGGFLVREVNRATDALIIAREFRPDLILMDVDMPDLNGGELVVCFRKCPEFVNLPIVFLTSMVSPNEGGETGLVRNGQRYLSKLDSQGTLLRTIRLLLPKGE